MDVASCNSCSCKGFVPQYWKNDKCKECFHAILDHVARVSATLPEHATLDRSSSISASSLNLSTNSLATAKSSRRNHIVKEIVSTEKSYVDNLTTYINVFAMPLKQIPPTILPAQHITSVFSNIVDIQNVNKTLLEGLQKRLENWSEEQKIGDVFLEMSPYLKMYMTYTSQYSKSIEDLAVCEKNQLFNNIVQKCIQRPECKSLDIRAFMIQPVQRIPRYNLLLDDLIKNTDPAHVDYADLCSALSKMKIVADSINQAIRVQENMKKVYEIQNNMIYANPMGDNQLVEPHRMFVREGLLSKVCRKSNKKYMFFLFTDLLVYADPILAGKCVHHRTMLLGDISTEPRADTPVFQHSFLVASGSKSFIAFAESDAERDSWLADIQEQQKQCLIRRESFRGSLMPASPTKHAPVWIPDEAALECHLCKDEFTFFNRRHHCRQCGEVVCSKCSNYKLMISTVDARNEVRVCSACFTTSSSPSTPRQLPEIPKPETPKPE